MKSLPACFSVLVLFFTIFSCGKNNGSPTPGNTDSIPVIPPVTPPVTPVPRVDSLGAWVKIGAQNGSKTVSDIWFVSASTGFITAGDNNIYRSVDSGKTWLSVSSFPGSPQGLLNLFFANNQQGFAQGMAQMASTSDGGNTWNLRSLPTADANTIFFSGPSTGYYAGGALYKTTDSARTWTEVYTPPVKTICFSYFLDANNGFLFTLYGDLLKTTDGAASWQLVSQNPAISTSNMYGFNNFQFTDAQTGYYSCYNGVFKTTDGGVSWNKIYATGGSVTVLKFFNANSGYYKADSAIYKTVNGGQSWTTSCTITGDGFNGMSFVDSNQGWACTYKGVILRLKK